MDKNGSESGRQRSPPVGVAVVADDDDDLRALMAESLVARGYSVVEAADGAELIERLNELGTKGKYLVVTDLDMPRVGGFAALDVIANRFPDAKVLVVTAWRDRVVEEEALARGATAVLAKPFKMHELAELADRETGANDVKSVRQR
jgi:CheY-like chemotaxis protein